MRETSPFIMNGSAVSQHAVKSGFSIYLSTSSFLIKELMKIGGADRK